MRGSEQKRGVLLGAPWPLQQRVWQPLPRHHRPESVPTAAARILCPRRVPPSIPSALCRRVCVPPGAPRHARSLFRTRGYATRWGTSSDRPNNCNHCHSSGWDPPGNRSSHFQSPRRVVGSSRSRLWGQTGEEGLPCVRKGLGRAACGLHSLRPPPQSHGLPRRQRCDPGTGRVLQQHSRQAGQDLQRLDSGQGDLPQVASWALQHRNGHSGSVGTPSTSVPDVHTGSTGPGLPCQA